MNNIWSADADMQLVSRHKAIHFLCVSDVFSKYACFIPLKDKKSETVTEAFQNIIKELNYKPNKICVD